MAGAGDGERDRVRWSGRARNCVGVEPCAGDGCGDGVEDAFIDGFATGFGKGDIEVGVRHRGLFSPTFEISTVADDGSRDGGTIARRGRLGTWVAGVKALVDGGTVE